MVIQTKKAKDRLHHQEVALDCWDKVTFHRNNLHTLASLLSYCGKNSEGIPAETICSVGFMLVEELEKMQVYLRQLAEANHLT